MTIWGFADGDDVLRLVPVNTADNFLHLAIAGRGHRRRRRLAGGAPADSDYCALT